MPLVTIEMWPMKPEQKPALIKGITDVFAGMDIPREAVNVVIHETHQDNWGSAGEQHSVKFKDIIEGMKKGNDKA
jgi:4-oxalocrotonate tautomerase family enzyme